MPFERKNIENFVRFNINAYKPNSGLNTGLLFIVWFFGTLVSLLGIYPIISILFISFCNIGTTISAIKFSRNKDYANFNLYYGVFAIDFSIICLLLSYKAFVVYQKQNILIFSLFIVIYLAVLYLWVKIIQRWIKSNKFGKFSFLDVFVPFGVAIGMILSRLFLKDISQEAAYMFVSITSMLLSLICSGGVLSILKYIYIRKFNLVIDLN